VDQDRAKDMKTKITVLTLCAILFALCSSAYGQQPGKIPRIGFLLAGSLSLQAARLKVFREGLRELGYVEGQNIAIEYRAAEGKFDRLPDLAAELVRLEVSMIVTSSTATLLAAKQATNKIPIIAATSGDLVGTGLVASLARPGGNVTGLTAISPDLSGKRLELLKEIVPKASRVAVLWNPSPWDEEEVRQTEIAAQGLGVKVQSLQVRQAKEFQSAYAAMTREGARAIIIIQGPFTALHRKEIMELTTKNRLPSMCDGENWTDYGCVISYGPNRSDLYRRAATYVDKILKGAKPADLPVEQPTKFEFVINLKAATQIGLNIPQSVLFRADRVIK
jgi:putative tryptophan/tyrosine transport system substrate-binding protein